MGSRYGVLRNNLNPCPIIKHYLSFLCTPTHSTPTNSPLYNDTENNTLYKPSLPNMNSNISLSMLSQSEQEKLIEKLRIFKIQGKDKRGHIILSIIGKHFPGRLVSVEAIKKYLENKVFPRLGERPFAIVYVHTGVDKTENFPGISALKSIYEAIPVKIKENLEAVYFLHPGLQSRLFLATFGRLIFTSRLYGKLKYKNRLGFLWENVRRKEIEIPEFVFEYDEQLEYQYPTMEYGLESDHPRGYGAPVVESSVSTYSMRSIA